MDYDDAFYKGNLAGIDEVEWLMEVRRDQILDEVKKAHPRMKWWRRDELVEEKVEGDEFFLELDRILEELYEIQSRIQEKQKKVLAKLVKKLPGLEGWQYRMYVEKVLGQDKEYGNLWSEYDGMLYDYEYIKEQMDADCA